MLGATNIRVMRGPASFHYLQVSNNPVSIPASEGWSNALIYPSRITILLNMNVGNIMLEHKFSFDIFSHTELCLNV